MSSPHAPSAPSAAPGTRDEGAAWEDGDAGLQLLSLQGLEVSLDTASLDALEAVARSVTKDWLRSGFSRISGTEEAALLTTCHRVEVLFLTSDATTVDRWRELLPGERVSWRAREGRDVVHHLFRVAAGRESLAVGEGEVRHQVRAAGASVESRHPRSVLRTLIAGAAATADELNPSVPRSRSIASAATTRLRELLSPSPPPAILVIGSGTVGRQVVEHLAAFSRVTVAYHRRPPDEAFLAVTGARAIPFDRLGPELAVSDAVITAAKFGDRGLGAADLPRNRPVLLVDLGVPRNIDPNVRSLANVRLIDLADLHAHPPRVASEDMDDVRVAEAAERFADRIDRLLLEPWVGAVRRAAEELRRAEMAQARPFLGQLDARQEQAVERLTHRLVTRLLLAPTERIRSLPPGPEGDVQRRLAVALLRPPASEP